MALHSVHAPRFHWKSETRLLLLDSVGTSLLTVYWYLTPGLVSWKSSWRTEMLSYTAWQAKTHGITRKHRYQNQSTVNTRDSFSSTWCGGGLVGLAPSWCCHKCQNCNLSERNWQTEFWSIQVFWFSESRKEQSLNLIQGLNRSHERFKTNHSNFSKAH